MCVFLCYYFSHRKGVGCLARRRIVPFVVLLQKDITKDKLSKRKGEGKGAGCPLSSRHFADQSSHPLLARLS